MIKLMRISLKPLNNQIDYSNFSNNQNLVKPKKKKPKYTKIQNENKINFKNIIQTFF